MSQQKNPLVVVFAVGFIFCPHVAADAPNSCSLSASGFSTTYDAQSSSDKTANALISISCSEPAQRVTLTISPGNFPSNSSNSAPQRRLQSTSSSAMLDYNLYLDSALLVVWGNTAANGRMVDVGTVTENVLVYAKIPARQAVQPGMYMDTVLVTANF